MNRASMELKSEALRAALRAAIAGQPRELEQLLARHGGLPGRPNLKLAAALGAELAEAPGAVAALLERFTDEDSLANDPRTYLPIAAAHAWMQRARAGRDVEQAWSALQVLAADPRAPVRLGTRQALCDGALREAGADALIARAASWLDDDQADRELQLGAAALVVETLSDPQIQGAVRDQEGMLSYLSNVMERVANAPRAAARSEGRRRVLTSLPLALARVVAFVRAQDRGFEWLRAECSQATHPDLRAALSKALLSLAEDARSSGAAVAELRKTLEASAKPVRDAARVRPGHGRGKRSRALR